MKTKQNKTQQCVKLENNMHFYQGNCGLSLWSGRREVNQS